MGFILQVHIKRTEAKTSAGGSIYGNIQFISFTVRTIDFLNYKYEYTLHYITYDTYMFVHFLQSLSFCESKSFI